MPPHATEKWDRSGMDISFFLNPFKSLTLCPQCCAEVSSLSVMLCCLQVPVLLRLFSQLHTVFPLSSIV